jgi:hypothetical protein
VSPYRLPDRPRWDKKVLFLLTLVPLSSFIHPRAGLDFRSTHSSLSCPSFDSFLPFYSGSSPFSLFSSFTMAAARTPRAVSRTGVLLIRDKTRQSRLAKLSEDDRRTDDNSIRDVDLKWFEHREWCLGLDCIERAYHPSQTPPESSGQAAGGRPADG